MGLVRDSKWAIFLRDGKIDEFNKLAEAETPKLQMADLRMCDLRKANLTNADLTDAYLRNADLRGADLSGAKLEGASLHDANIAGVLFPVSLAASEIRLSVSHGTRMRCR